MKEFEAGLLVSEIDSALDALEKIFNIFSEKAASIASSDELNLEAAIVVSDLMCRGYTCLETVFLRVSQFFENSLAAEAWHKELLMKMRLQVPGIRPAVISPEVFWALDELRRFRHFNRYYYELHFEQPKLRVVCERFGFVCQTAPVELRRFQEFCRKLTK